MIIPSEDYILSDEGLTRHSPPNVEMADVAVHASESSPRLNEGGWPDITGYRISARLGAGGMGTVYRALQVSTNREVALKVIRAEVGLSPHLRALFTQEVRLAARLQHSSIVRIYDSGIDCDLYYYAMELIEGETLDHYALRIEYEPSGTIRYTPILSRRKVLELMQQVCNGVHEAHLRGIIHRDLKPRNIMVTPDGKPHLLDFGLATSAIQERIDESVSQTLSDQPIEGRSNTPPMQVASSTSTRDFVGTPAFMSPEQSHGRKGDLDIRTDVYSLGVTLYLLLTGQLPRDVTGGAETIVRKVAAAPVIPPRKLNERIDREIEALLLKSLAPDRNNRYASAGLMADDLGRYLGRRPLQALKQKPSYLVRKWISRNQRAFMLGTWLILLIAGLSSYLYRSRRALQVTQENQARFKQMFESTLAPFASQAGGRKVENRKLLNDMALSAVRTFPNQPDDQARFLEIAGMALMNQGWCREGEAHLKHAVDLQVKYTGGCDLISIRMINDLAEVERELGQSAASARLSEKAFLLSEKVHDVRDERVRSLIEWAYALDDQGRPEQAIVRATQALNEAAPDNQNSFIDPQVLRAKFTLAFVLRDLHKLDDSLALANKVYEAQNLNSHSDEIDPGTLRSKDLCATILMLQGDDQKAMQLIEEVVARSESALRVDHTDRIGFKYDKGLILVNQKRFGDAVGYLRETLNSSKLVSGEEDLSSINLMYALAHAERLWASSSCPPIQRFYTRVEAEGLLKQAIALLDQPHGTDDPRLLLFEDELGYIESARNELSEAEKIFQNALEIRRTRLSPMDPDLRASIFRLADNLFYERKWSDAEPLYTEALNLSIKTDGNGSDGANKARKMLNLVHTNLQQRNP